VFNQSSIDVNKILLKLSLKGFLSLSQTSVGKNNVPQKKSCGSAEMGNQNH